MLFLGGNAYRFLYFLYFVTFSTIHMYSFSGQVFKVIILKNLGSSFTEFKVLPLKYFYVRNNNVIA